MSTIEDNYPFAPDFDIDAQERMFRETNKEVLKHFRVKRLKFALSKKQREELLEKAESKNDLHYKMIFTMLRTGLRVSELVNLRIEDVNLNGKYIKVEKYDATKHVKAYEPKTESAQRMIPIEKELVTKLRNYKNTRKRKEGYFFVSQRKNGFHPKSVINFINGYARKCKTIGHCIGSHSLRRTFASYLINDGIPVGTISKFLGHASIKITMIYLYDIVSEEEMDMVRKSISKM